jgi:drug/metabolite transporter (DMT)-like permease
MPKLSEHVYGTSLTALGVLILTPDGLLVRLIDAEPWTLLFWRGALFGLCIACFYLIKEKKNFLSIFRKMGWAGLLAAACFTSSTVFFVQSLHHTSVANTLVLIATAPLFAAILARLFLKEKLLPATWIAILISVGGIAYIFSGSLSSNHLFGDFLALGASLSLASQITTVRMSRSVDMVPSLIIAGGMITIIGAFMAGDVSTSEKDMYLLLLLGGLILPLSFALITVGPRFIPAAEVSLLMLVETFLGPLWVWLALGERPADETLWGGILVLATLATHSVYVARRSARPIMP